jgi:plasmid stabilization system protein ParE
VVRLLWTRLAIADLDSIPRPVEDRVVAQVELLAEFPSMGASMDGPFEGFRQLVVGRYRLIYQVAGDEVRIAYIRHSARQLRLRIVRDDD